MQKPYLFFAIILFIVFSGSSTSFAWDDVGHKITGYIAWHRMSPQARDNVIRTLRSAPEDSDIATFFMAFGPKSDELKRLEYFMFLPTWADVVRDRAFPMRYSKYHRSNWHYSDTFWRQLDGRAEMITDKEPGGQGVVQMNAMDRTMRDAAAADTEKAVAISWFLHIGGDLHQPLHTSGRHTDREPSGDQGGNLFQLTPEGTKREDQVNLHWFWDSIVTRNVPYNAGLCESDYIKNISDTMMTRYPYDSLKDSLELGKYELWQQQSFQLAVSEVFRADLKRFEMPSDAYRRNAFNVAEQRLAIAGYRLGETLNDIFGK